MQENLTPTISKKITTTKRQLQRNLGVKNRKSTGADPGVKMNGSPISRKDVKRILALKDMPEPDWETASEAELVRCEGLATHRMSGGEYSFWKPIRMRIRQALRKKQRERLQLG